MHGPRLELMTTEKDFAAVTGPLERHRALAGQIVRFGMTGVLNTSICLVILFVLHEQYHVNEWIASITGYSVATVQSFIFSKYWTFAGDHKARAHSQFVAFVVLNVIGGGMFSTGVHLLSPVLGLRIGSLVSTVVVVVFNFLGSKMFVFRKAEE